MIGVPKRQDGDERRGGQVCLVDTRRSRMPDKVSDGMEMDLDGHRAGLLSSVSPVGQTGSGYPTDVSTIRWLPHYPTLQAITLD